MSCIFCLQIKPGKQAKEISMSACAILEEKRDEQWRETVQRIQKAHAHVIIQ